MSVIQTAGQIGAISIRNRLVMAPICTNTADSQGKVTTKTLDYYYSRLSSGAIGLAQTGHLFVSDEGRASTKQGSICSDEDVSGLAQLARVAHQTGTPIVAQLSHAGSAALSIHAPNAPTPIAPSTVLCPGAKQGQPLPRAMTTEDFVQVRSSFAHAARRAMEAGFDGVEIHLAHGYLLNEFLSPLTNARHDEYACKDGTPCLEARLRFPLEVVQAVRAELPAGAIFSVRLGGCDYMPGGNTVHEAVLAALALARVGANLLSVSGGMCYWKRVDHDEPGYFANSSAPIRRALRAESKVPTGEAATSETAANANPAVMLTGGVKSAADAERLLKSGVCDLVGAGRAIRQNARWAPRELRRLRLRESRG